MTSNTGDDEPFDDLFAEMDDFLRRMQEQMMGGLGGIDDLDDAAVGGFSVTHRPGEEPDVSTFGDVDPADIGATPGSAAGSTHRGARDAARGTHVEVHRDGDVVRVVGELPGVAEDDIDLSATERRLHVAADAGDRSYDESVELPTPVDPDSATARYNNGVLEVELDALDDANAKDIQIE